MKEKIAFIIKNNISEIDINLDEINVEIPKQKNNGDYSSNIALKLSKRLGKSPMDIANNIASNINETFITKVEAVAPGFLNFYIKKDYLFDNIKNVLTLKENYGSSNIGNHEKINIEFVSANPTGILHMGNARGGAYGDSLARIMTFCGYDVTKEYYLNDNGNQIGKLANSIYSRYQDLCGIENEFPEDGYPGEEIKTIAKIIYDKYGKDLNRDNINIFREEGINYLKEQIFKDLEEYRIKYDVITSEKSIYDKYPINELLDKMNKNGYLYENEGATWFKSSSIYDDQDHVLVKSDGTYTYLVPDISYHIDKLNRGYDKLIDVLGTDHHGYVNRLKGAIKAYGGDDSKLSVKLLQLVRIVRNGEVASMHKRSGNVITLKDLMDEVGVNATRYYFSRYSLDTQMDFDIELAKSKSNDNPVFYVCYAYARICSILNKYNDIKIVNDFNLINNESAYNVLEKVYNFPEVVQSACNKQTPHVITNYVYDLACSFHNFYENSRIITDNEEETLENLNIINAVKITIYNALNLIGVIPEERM